MQLPPRSCFPSFLFFPRFLSLSFCCWKGSLFPPFLSMKSLISSFSDHAYFVRFIRHIKTLFVICCFILCSLFWTDFLVWTRPSSGAAKPPLATTSVCACLCRFHHRVPACMHAVTSFLVVAGYILAMCEHEKRNNQQLQF